MKYPARSASRCPPGSVYIEKPLADTGTMAWLASIWAGRTTFIVEVVGATLGSVAPAVPTVMYPIVSGSTEVALSTTAETSARPIAGLLVTGTSKLLLIGGRVVPPSGFKPAIRVSTTRVGVVIGTNSPVVDDGAEAPV